MRRLLLVSTSTTHGTGYLDHCAAEIDDLLVGIRHVVFVPYALKDRDAYAARVVERFARMSRTIEPLHRAKDPIGTIEKAPAVFIGGGNTFRLLLELERLRLLEPIRRRALLDMPYLGSSAGSNVACPSIRTTNDMPIVWPGSLDALGLVPFNINPHYLDADPASTHMGETRETRIREFHEENDPPVVGLREGAMLRIDGAKGTLRGTAGARVFLRGAEPRELAPGDPIDFLLAG